MKALANESALNPSGPRINRAGWLACLVIVAAALRIVASLNDLWLDEIWSMTSVWKISSPWDVFAKIHLDNNHYLYSLWLYCCGDHGDWPGYRIPAVVAGIGSVIMAGLIGRRRNGRTALIAMFLMTFSYVQILYSSEARGFSLVVLFSFAAFYALERFMESLHVHDWTRIRTINLAADSFPLPAGEGQGEGESLSRKRRFMERESWPYALAFSGCSILGFISHLIFLNFYAAAFVWSGWRFAKSGLQTSQALKSMLACHLAPVAFFAALYFVDIRHLIVGGGTSASLPVTFFESLAWSIGTLQGYMWTAVSGAFAVGLSFTAIWLLKRQNSDAWIFFAGVIVVVPFLVTLAHHSDAIYVRHFIVGMAFLLILASFVLDEVYQRGAVGRFVCLLLMAAYLIVNGWNTKTLFQYGRGHYRDAVQFLINNTKGPDVSIGTDHDFRVSLVLRFYVDLATGDKTINYYPRASWPHKGPEWVICHKEAYEDPSPPAKAPTDAAGNKYDYVKTFRAAPLSGLHWFIYHNASFGAVQSD